MWLEPPAHRSSQRALRALVALAAVAIAGCASEPVVLETAPAQPTARIGRSIVFLHSAEFRNRQETLEPYGNRYYLPLKVGEASDKALRATYERLFASAREASSPDAAASAGAPPATALLEPSIVGLKYLNASRRMEGPFYAEVDYRFRLSGADGPTLAEWTVHGFGRYPDANWQPRTKDSPPGPRSETGLLVEAPRRAVEDGVAAFVRSFERVPELIRWSRGEAVADANAPPAALVTQGALSSAAAVDASYPGVFALRVERAALPKPAKPASEDGTPELPLVALRLTLRNETERRLLLDPADIEWTRAGAATLEPIPPAVAAALVTRAPFGLSIIGGVGPAALPGLIAALISAGELARHQSEYAAWSAAVAAETLVDGVAGARSARSGLVYFPRSGAPTGALVVRVIDLDRAVRYTVRVPVEGG